MTKLRWEKADQRILDPARVIDVPDRTPPERASPAIDRSSPDELRRRSEERDTDLMYLGALRRVQMRLAAGEELSGFDQLVLREAAKRGLQAT